MSNIIKDLREEHKGFRELLALLQKKVDMLEQIIPIDYKILADAIHYIEKYAGLYHHPKEDIIYDYIIDNKLDNKDFFAKTIKEHDMFKQLTQQLSTSLDSILLDVILPADVFCSQLKHFIQAEKSHLDKEERLIFPLIESLLVDKDWEIINEKIPSQIEDPLFGKMVNEEFLDLYKRLQTKNTQ